MQSRIRNTPQSLLRSNLIDERSDDYGEEEYDFDLELALDKLDIDPAAREIVRQTS